MTSRLCSTRQSSPRHPRLYPTRRTTLRSHDRNSGRSCIRSLCEHLDLSSSLILCLRSLTLGPFRYACRRNVMLIRCAMRFLGPNSRTRRMRQRHGKTSSASAKATSPPARSRRSATPSASSGWAAPNTACGNPKARCSLPIVLPSSSSLVPRHFMHRPHQTSITSSNPPPPSPPRPATPRTLEPFGRVCTHARGPDTIFVARGVDAIPR